MYAYLLFPNDSSLSFIGITIKSNYRDSIQHLLYFVFSKIHLVFLVSIIFLTTSDWWKYFLIPILILYYYQIEGILLDQGFSVSMSYFISTTIFIINLIILFVLNNKAVKLRNNYYNVLNLDILKEILEIRKNELLNNQLYKKINSQNIDNILEVNKIEDEVRELHSMLMLKDKAKNNSIKLKSNFGNYLIAIILLSVPFLIYSFEFIPKNIENWDFKIFKIKTSYEAATFFMWLISFKIALFILLIIWYFTTKEIWRFAILIHVAVVAFQIIEIFKGSRFVDEYELIFALPIIIPLLILLVFLSKWLKYKSTNEILNEAVRERIDILISKISELKLKESNLSIGLENLRKKRNDLKEEDYFNQLNSLKKSLENTLNTNP